ncbi:MAG: PolC-type DNA polymerase III [Agathobacter sp.]
MDQKRNYTVIDLEMTGLDVKKDKVIEIGAVKVRGGIVVDTFGTLVDSKADIPERVTELTGITNEMAAGGMPEDEAMERLAAFIGEDAIVGHNVTFDYRFVKQWAVNRKLPLELAAFDTLQLARILLPKESSKKLENLCEFFGIERKNAHRALDDALETQQVFECLKRLAEEANMAIEPKRLLCKIKRQTPATPHQVERLKELREKYRIRDEVCWEVLTRSEASRLQDFYYTHYGR